MLMSEILRSFEAINQNERRISKYCVNSNDILRITKLMIT